MDRSGAGDNWTIHTWAEFLWVGGHTSGCGPRGSGRGKRRIGTLERGGQHFRYWLGTVVRLAHIGAPVELHRVAKGPGYLSAMVLERDGSQVGQLVAYMAGGSGTRLV